ncbi:hypothetical protein M125_1028 [Bacteroides fragilis str. 3998T(B)3]|jgi:hypothetical protein|uniref:Uncharacterized protein n=1 Tax=Bacteroides fragilis str. 3998T(B)3 TaxID=1339316 RepID=A0A015W225_BACFG|nr:hypothetical protein M125_1028 [Bacteroides fragilis str. 3998T(B)3]
MLPQTGYLTGIYVLSNSTGISDIKKNVEYSMQLHGFFPFVAQYLKFFSIFASNKAAP